MIHMLDENNGKKFSLIDNPYDTTYFLPPDSTDEIEISFPRKLSITYLKRAPEDTYLRQYKLPMNIGTQITYVDLFDAVAIKLNGYYYDQKDWVNQGYWSWKNLADQVPYDYNP